MNPDLLRNYYYSLLWRLRLYKPPDRKILEEVILPFYSAHPSFKRILFVGVSWYVTAYKKYFSHQEYITLDPNGSRKKYGADHHIVGSIERLHEYFAPEYFDLIILNGVLGWGLNDCSTANCGIETCFSHLRCDGEMIVGINHDKPTTPNFSSLDALKKFKPVVFEPLGEHRHVIPLPFKSGDHTYYFFRKSSEQFP